MVTIEPIYETDNPKLPENYGPIILCLSKVFTSIINKIELLIESRNTFFTMEHIFTLF